MMDQDYARRLAVLNELVEISLVLNSSLSVDRVLTQLMDATTRVLKAETASVILRDENTNELHFVAMPTAAAKAEQLMRMPIPLEGSLAGAIIRENEAIVLDDVSQDPRHYRNTDAESGFVTRSLLGVPMRIKDRVVGALQAVNKIGDRWEEADQHFLEILAAQAAIALEKAQLIEELQRANKELSQLDKLKSDFIAIASHELRTPLGVIMGYASFLKEEADGELSDHANAVLNSALRMRALIEDMMNLRLLNMGESELQRESVSIQDLMLLARNDVISIVEAKGHHLRMGLPADEVMLEIDRAKMLKAVTTLLENAVKFTPPANGQIKMQCEDRGNEMWIIVSDNGVGIPADALQDIFKPFFQVEDHMTRHHGGMGLGLAIAKAVVETHRGRVWAESEGPGLGAAFYISLPKG